MKSICLPVALIVATAFGSAALAQTATAPAVAATEPAQTTGGVSLYQTIVADTRDLVDGGDLAGAERRISDLETALGKTVSALRAKDKAAWTSLEKAAEGAYASLRADVPDVATVKAKLMVLGSELKTPLIADAPPMALAPEPDAIHVTDAEDKPIPCTEMLETLKFRTASSARFNDSEVSALQTQGIELCDGGDDAGADDYFARALELLAE